VYDDIGGSILGTVSNVLRNAESGEFHEFVDTVAAMGRVFIVGAGRSGLVGRFFGMRLMHLGKDVHIVGDTMTPSIGRGDLLIAISGSGATSSVVATVVKAKEHGAMVISLSAQCGGRQCAITDHSDIHIALERRFDTDRRQQFSQLGPGRDQVRIAPMGTTYELGTLMYFEAAIAEMIRRHAISETEMRRRHTNLE